MRRFLLAYAMLTGTVHPALSQSAWWEAARNPASGVPCCGEADGRRVQTCYRDSTQWSLDDMGWRIMLKGTCTPVPPHAVLLGYPPHPSGAAAAWFAPDGTITCFVPPRAGG